MLGFSVFLSEEITEETAAYVEMMSRSGFTHVFTSLHIPEDDSSQYVPRLKSLGEILKAHHMNLMVDISTTGLKQIGFDISSEDDLKAIKKLGITGLRMDYGLDLETMAFLSHHITVGLNASTLSQADAKELGRLGANFNNMELLHNYYPRPETGLSEASFREKNRQFHHLGIKNSAFVPGDARLRGPLHLGLPTLEKHRDVHPLAAAIELFQDDTIDGVYIGDETIQPLTAQQFYQYFKEACVLLPVSVKSEAHRTLFIDTHTNRMDDARDVVRSQEARFKTIPTIEPDNTVSRTVGSVTLDNCLYGRYMGELQVVKRPLPADEKVNVVATIDTPHCDLVQWIQPGQKFELVPKEKA